MQAAAGWSAPSMLDEFQTTPPATRVEGVVPPLPPAHMCPPLSLAGEGW